MTFQSFLITINIYYQFDDLVGGTDEALVALQNQSCSSGSISVTGIHGAFADDGHFPRFDVIWCGGLPDDKVGYPFLQKGKLP